MRGLESDPLPLVSLRLHLRGNAPLCCGFCLLETFLLPVLPGLMKAARAAAALGGGRLEGCIGEKRSLAALTSRPSGN